MKFNLVPWLQRLGSLFFTFAHCKCGCGDYFLSVGPFEFSWRKGEL